MHIIKAAPPTLDLFRLSTTQNDGFAFTALVIDSLAKFKIIQHRHRGNKSASEKMKKSLSIVRDCLRRFRGLEFVARPLPLAGDEVAVNWIDWWEDEVESFKLKL
jgi:hypothetical protein